MLNKVRGRFQRSPTKTESSTIWMAWGFYRKSHKKIARDNHLHNVFVLCEVKEWINYVKSKKCSNQINYLQV